MARAESADCINFSQPKLVFECDEIDEEGTQFYGMPINLYEGLYLGMTWIYPKGLMVQSTLRWPPVEMATTSNAFWIDRLSSP